MPTLKLTIAYDGTDFEGWQLQPGHRTVQGVIEEGLLALSGRPLRPVAAGRTDSGVHAVGQVLSLVLPEDLNLPVRAFVRGLNGLLPADAAVLEGQLVAPTFDARRDARGKRYRYLVLNRPTRHPLVRRTHCVVFRPLDVTAMQEAAGHLLGEHDFSAFRASDCQSRTAVRRLRQLDVLARSEGEIAFEVEGRAFLKHMVRNLVGTLLDVGAGKRAAGSLPELLRSRDRRLAGPTAPPQGLTLVEVCYPEESPC